MNKKGVTLVELLIVIVVLGIISTFGTIATARIIKNSKTNALINEFQIIEEAAKLYNMDVNERPYGTLSGAGTCAAWNTDSRQVFIEGVRDGSPIPKWSGPYMNRWLDETPIGGCYVYRSYLVGAQSWARSNWYRYDDNATMGDVAPIDQDIEIIMVRFYPLTGQDAIAEMQEALAYLSDHISEEHLFYVNGQAVLGYYVIPEN